MIILINELGHEIKKVEKKKLKINKNKRFEWKEDKKIVGEFPLKINFICVKNFCTPTI